MVEINRLAMPVRGFANCRVSEALAHESINYAFKEALVALSIAEHNSRLVQCS